MNNEQVTELKNCDSSEKKEIYFYEINAFPKFKILEENYSDILNELLSIVKKENKISLIDERERNQDNNSCQISEQNKQILKKDPYSNFSYSGENSFNSPINNNIKTKENIHGEQLDHEIINNLNIYNKNNENSDKHCNCGCEGDKNINSNKFNQNIKDELNENNNDIKSYKTFQPWVEKNLYYESNEDGWDVAPVMIGGVKIPDRCKKFPILCGLLDQISGVISASFSLLKPGTHIVPHKGYDDYSEKMYRYHLGMIIPEGDVAIRVEKEIRKWENAKSFIFDDFLVHEAWNFTSENRIVLIIDFLKDENSLPNNIQFYDKNFNKSIKGFLNEEVIYSNSDESDNE